MGKWLASFSDEDGISACLHLVAVHSPDWAALKAVDYRVPIETSSYVLMVADLLPLPHLLQTISGPICVPFVILF